MSRTEASELRGLLDATKAELSKAQEREFDVFNLHPPTIGRDFYSKRIRLICRTCQPKGEDLKRISPAVSWPCATVRLVLDPVCFQGFEASSSADLPDLPIGSKGADRKDVGSLPRCPHYLDDARCTRVVHDGHHEVTDGDSVITWPAAGLER